MIQVRPERTNGRMSGFTVRGHADYAAAGEDIVCAAVSAVTLTAALGLKDVLRKAGTYENEAGILTVRLTDPLDEATELIFQTMLTGLAEISRQYPQHIRILD